MSYCIHDLPKGQCYLCKTDEWHEGVINADGDNLIRALERVAAGDRGHHESTRSSISTKEGQTI